MSPTPAVPAMASRISATKWPTPERGPTSGVTSRATWSVASDPIAPVLQAVPQRLLEGDGRFPTGTLLELGRVAHQQLDVGRPHALGHGPHLDVDLGHRQEHVEHAPDRQGL